MENTEHNKNDHRPIENGGNCEDLNNKGTENQTASELVVVLDSDGGGAAKTGGTSCFTGTAYKPIPPFLLKIHDMLENNETNSVISWGCNGASFVITNPHSFADNVLPMYFRHNNFQSFIAQLNSYGFRKISWEHWEYSNEHFRKGERHLLKNIKRRNQISQNNNIDPSSEAQLTLGTPRNMEKELEAMMNEHDQLKREIANLKDTQEALERKLASLKDQAMMINDTKGIMSVRKRKLEEKLSATANQDDDDMKPIDTMCSDDQFGGSCSGGDNSTSCLANISEFVSEHFKQPGDKITVLDEEEMGKHDQTNTLISLEEMFGESSSDWVEYFKDLREKASHLKS